MPTYLELQEQIHTLQRQAELARLNEVSAAIAQIKTLMETYGISASELEQSSQKGRIRSAVSVAAKYRDPNTGATWSGRGRTPRWLNGRDKEKFLIA